METVSATIASVPPPSLEARFSCGGFVLATLMALVFGAFWAWFADAAQFYFAPILVFPVLVGIFSGLSIVGLVRFAQIGHRPTILLAVLLAASVAALGQHGFGYLNTYYFPPSTNTASLSVSDLSSVARQARPGFGKYMLSQAERGRPLFGRFVARGGVAWLTWAVDLLLTICGAVVVTMPALRVPYCSRCNTWYRTVRGGKIDRQTALQLAELLGVEQTGSIRSPRYRLTTCQNGCGPTRCELSWEEGFGSLDLVQVWLDAEGRSRVVAILDGLNNES